MLGLNSKMKEMLKDYCNLIIFIILPLFYTKKCCRAREKIQREVYEKENVLKNVLT